ncbi:MAG: hypothetical protein AAGA90_05675 [Actinomycetota bacterium]
MGIAIIPDHPIFVGHCNFRAQEEDSFEEYSPFGSFISSTILAALCTKVMPIACTGNMHPLSSWLALLEELTGVLGIANTVCSQRNDLAEFHTLRCGKPPDRIFVYVWLAF